MLTRRPDQPDGIRVLSGSDVVGGTRLAETGADTVKLGGLLKRLARAGLAVRPKWPVIA